MTQNVVPVLKRRYRIMAARPVLFVDIATRSVAFEDGVVQYIRAVERGQTVLLFDVLRIASDKAEVVYLLGGWNAAATPKTQWFAAPDGWQRVAYNRGPLIAIYKHAETGRRVTIYATAQWFGVCDSLGACQSAYTRLTNMLRASFGQEVNLKGTPAQTGLDLIERSLPTNKEGVSYEWPVLDVEVREMIEQNIGQGRMEMLAQSERTPQTDALYILDAVWMYSACVRRLPSLPLQHDEIQEFAGYRVGFYHIKFQVPVGWAHIGLLPTWNPKAKRSVWPSRPGSYWYESYVCSEELRLALENGWPTQIIERWLFAEGDREAQDPLKTWIEKLKLLREKAGDDTLVRGAIRAICIKAIGGLHRKGRFERIETPIENMDAIPDDAEIVWRTESHILWKRPIPLHKTMEHFQHPEWPAAVWGRSRWRLARAALQLPRESIIALRSDAIVCTFNPGWASEKSGEFRVKETIALNGRGLPKTTREYLDLLQSDDDTEDE